MKRRISPMLLAAATVAALIPITSASASDLVEVTGTVSSPSGIESAGHVYFVQDGGVVDLADIVDGAYSVLLPAGEYDAHFYLGARLGETPTNEVLFNKPVVIGPGAPELVTDIAMQPVTVDVTDDEGEPLPGDVRLGCSKSRGGYSFWRVAGSGERTLWGLEASQCTLGVNSDGLARSQDLALGSEPRTVSLSMETHQLGGALDLPAQWASQVTVSTRIGFSEISRVTVPSTADQYAIPTLSGPQQVQVEAHTSAPFRSLRIQRPVDVQDDAVVDVVVPSAPVQVHVAGAQPSAELPVLLTCESQQGGHTRLAYSSVYRESDGGPATVLGLPTSADMTCTLRVTVADRDVDASVSVKASGVNAITLDLSTGEVTYADADGVDEAVEAQAPNGGDGNADGVPDAEQDNVTSLPRSGGAPDPDAGTWVTLAAPAGTTLEDVTTSDAASLPAPPDGVTFPAGLVSFRLSGIAPGSTQTIEVVTPGTQAVLDYAKFHDGTWSLLPRERVEGSAGLTRISLTDGGAGDADGQPNGVIVDPGGIADLADLYRFDGFLNPINDPRSMPSAPMSVFKRNSTVPVAFVLKDASGNVVTPGSPPRWLTPTRLSATSAGVNESVLTAPATDDGEFVLHGDRWQYNWSTKTLTPGYTYRIGARLDDGSTHYVTVALR